MPDEYDERFRQHEEILRSLTAMLVRMDNYLEAQQETNRQHQEFNARQVEINQDVKTTLARLATLTARIVRADSNGRDA